MNFRDRILPHNEEEQPSTITFTLDRDWTNMSSYCSKSELAQFLLNIVNTASEMIEDNDLPEEWKEVIYSTWRRNIKNLPNNKKRC